MQIINLETEEKKKKEKKNNNSIFIWMKNLVTPRSKIKYEI